MKNQSENYIYSTKQGRSGNLSGKENRGMRDVIHEMIDKIQSEKLLERIYNFVSYIYINLTD